MYRGVGARTQLATKFLVLDFSRVLGIDATAARSLFATLVRTLSNYGTVTPFTRNFLCVACVRRIFPNTCNKKIKDYPHERVAEVMVGMSHTFLVLCWVL